MSELAVLDALVRGAQRELSNVKDFVTTTKGPFEFADAVVRDARRTVREAGEAVGVRVPFYGQRAIMERLRRRY